MSDLTEIARRVRRDCLAHVPRNLAPDARAMLIEHIEMAIGKTLGEIGTQVSTEMPAPDKEPEPEAPMPHKEPVPTEVTE